MSTEDKKSALEVAEELFRFLQGEVPERCVIEADNMPRLTPDQAWTVVWYLGNLYTSISDEIQRCDGCGDLVDTCCERMEWVESKQQMLCESCYRESSAYECCACEDHDCHSGPGRLVVVAEEVQGLPEGLYRITSWPFYASGMVTMHVFNQALERVGDVPEDVDTRGYEMGFLCAECEKKCLDSGTGQQDGRGSLPCHGVASAYRDAGGWVLYDAKEQVIEEWPEGWRDGVSEGFLTAQGVRVVR